MSDIKQGDRVIVINGTLGEDSPNIGRLALVIGVYTNVLGIAYSARILIDNFIIISDNKWSVFSGTIICPISWLKQADPNDSDDTTKRDEFFEKTSTFAK